MEPLNYALQLCEEYNTKLLFLTKSGSHLYGTNTPNSDSDYIGLFIQAPQSVLVGDRIDHIVRSTGDDKGKNCKDDIYITLWNITYWLKTLLSRGDTGAMDLFYAIHNKVNVLYNFYSFAEMLDTNRTCFFDPLKAKSFVGYATTQANRYGTKGERLEVLKNVYEWISFGADGVDFEKDFLSVHMNALVNMYGHEKYFFLTETNNVPSVGLLGKTFMGTISMQEFYNRVKTMYEKYGHRAHTAAEVGGIDWKALSHAVRVLFEYIHLLKNGYIKFPLPEGDKNYVLSVKKGEQDFDAVQDVLNNLFEEIESIEPCVYVKNMKYYRNAIDNIILNFYLVLYHVGIKE